MRSLKGIDLTGTEWLTRGNFHIRIKESHLKKGFFIGNYPIQDPNVNLVWNTQGNCIKAKHKLEIDMNCEEFDLMTRISGRCYK